METHAARGARTLLEKRLLCFLDYPTRGVDGLTRTMHYFYIGAKSTASSYSCTRLMFRDTLFAGRSMPWVAKIAARLRFRASLSGLTRRRRHRRKKKRAPRRPNRSPLLMDSLNLVRFHLRRLTRWTKDLVHLY